MTQKADDLGVKILLFYQTPSPMQCGRGSFPCYLKCLCVRGEHTYKRRSDKDVINTPRKGCCCQMGVQILPDSHNICVYILKETHMERYNSISNTYIWKQQRDMEPSTHFFSSFFTHVFLCLWDREESVDTVRAERAEEVNVNNGLKGTVRVEKGSHKKRRWMTITSLDIYYLPF